MIISFYIACALLPIGLLVCIVVRLLYRRSSQVILCMECEQCMGVCPILKKKGLDFIGPTGIMVAAKSGNIRRAVESGALLCTGCRLCEKACPRGLAPYREVEKWKDMFQSNDHMRVGTGNHGPGTGGGDMSMPGAAAGIIQ